MNRDDIIRMAVDAGIIPWTKHEYVGGKNFSASDEGLDGDLASLIQFAALVASAEREVIAQMIEDAPALMEFAQNDQGGCLMCGFTPKLAAKTIRATGDKHD